MPRPALPAAALERFRVQLLDGRPVADAARAAGISTRSASRWLAEHHIEVGVAALPRALQAALLAAPAVRLLFARPGRGRPGGQLNERARAPQPGDEK